MKTRHLAAGFTLVELMITIAILAIISAFAVPSFSDMIERNRRASCSNELVGALQLARSEAVRLGRNITVDALENDDVATGITITAPDDTVLRQTAVCNGSAVALADGGLPFDYRANGQTDMAVDEQLDVRICDATGTSGRLISLLPTGVLRNTPLDDCNS